MKKSIKNKVIKALDAAGYAPFIAAWCREDGEPLRLNNETWSDDVLPPYSPYSEDYESYDMGVHVKVMAIAEQFGCYWENVNGAETELCEG